jgi:hypothetical protein
MILRITQKLCAKIKAGTLGEMPLHKNPYADWSCRLFTVNHTQYIILSNTSSLYSCLMLGKGITDNRLFIERALGTIREFMEDDGQQFAYRKFVAPVRDTASLAKTLNRSVTGSMNDLVIGAKWFLADGMPLYEVSHRVNETPLSALGYANPKEAFQTLGNRTEQEQ